MLLPAKKPETKNPLIVITPNNDNHNFIFSPNFKAVDLTPTSKSSSLS